MSAANPSDPEPPAAPVDPALNLSRSTYLHLLHTLRGLLPPPEADTPEALVHRDNTAIAQVAAMLPVNADEATLAAQCVGARAYAADCLRLARIYRANDHAYFLKCTAQASRMTRDADRGRVLLQRLQAERRRREQDSAASDRAAWTEHCTIGFMTRTTPEATTGATPEAMPDEPPPAPAPQPPAPLPPDKPVTEQMAEAERYALIYPQRAALIRRLGGVPENVTFGPPDEELVQALVTGRTPALLALDDAECLVGRSAVSTHASRD